MTRLLASVLVLTAAAAAAQPSLVLHNGRVWTGDPDRPWAEAVAIDGDRIAAVGADAEVLALAADATRRVDAGGRLVVPGLNDAHLHASAPGDAVRLALAPGPQPDPAWDAVLEAVAGAAAETEAGRWLSGLVGPAVLDDPRAGRAGLDRAAPDHPVVLWGHTGHGMVLNTAALDRLDLDADALDRPGGWQVHRDGEGTGVLHEYAVQVARRRMQQALPAEAHAAAYRALADRLAQWGVTSVQHHANDLPLAETAAALDAAAVPIRWGVLRWPIPDEDVFEAWSEDRVGPSAPRTRLIGVKWMLDGTPVERLAALRAPYADRPGHHGRVNFSEAEVRRMLAMALMVDERVAFHIGGDSTLAVVLRAMAGLAPPAAWRARRVRLEHGDAMGPDQLAAVRDYGLVLVQNPLHVGSPTLMRDRLGRSDGVQLLRSAVEAGVPVALGADAGGPGLNPFLNLMLATAHPSNPAEALTLEQALTAYTYGSALAEGMEAEKGVLRPGYLADLAVLSQDLFATPPDAWPATESVLTVVGGEIVHESLGR